MAQPTAPREKAREQVSGPKRGLVHLGALVGYALLTLLMTWPLARNLTTAIPGDSFDGWQNYWNQWWIKTALVDGLVKDGLVERHYTPDDRRVINVSISDAGRETVRSMKSRIRTQMRGLLSHLPESDLQTLCSCGEKISDVIGKIP